MESTLSSPCFRPDSSLSRQDAALAHLDSLSPQDLVLRSHGSVPFPFNKGSYGVLVNCSLCGTEATLSLSAGPLCSSFSDEACTILQALCWSRQHQQVCHCSFLLLFSYSCTNFSTLSSFSSFFLRQSFWQIGQELFSLSPPRVLLGYDGSRTLVSPWKRCD